MTASPDDGVQLADVATPPLLRVSELTAGYDGIRALHSLSFDVLAGTIAGLLAQGLAPPNAAAVGVYLHGAAGELLGNEFGDSGGLASDLLRFLPAARLEILRVH